MFSFEKSPLSCEAVGGEEGVVVAGLGDEGEIHWELEVCQRPGQVAHSRLTVRIRITDQIRPSETRIKTLLIGNWACSTHSA